MYYDIPSSPSSQLLPGGSGFRLGQSAPQLRRGAAAVGLQRCQLWDQSCPAGGGPGWRGWMTQDFWGWVMAPWYLVNPKIAGIYGCE